MRARNRSWRSAFRRAVARPPAWQSGRAIFGAQAATQLRCDGECLTRIPRWRAPVSRMANPSAEAPAASFTDSARMYALSGASSLGFTPTVQPGRSSRREACPGVGSRGRCPHLAWRRPQAENRPRPTQSSAARSRRRERCRPARRARSAGRDRSRLQLDGRRRAVTGGGAARSMCVTARSRGSLWRGGDSGSR